MFVLDRLLEEDGVTGDQYGPYDPEFVVSERERLRRDKVLCGQDSGLIVFDVQGMLLTLLTVVRARVRCDRVSPARCLVSVVAVLSMQQRAGCSVGLQHSR